MVSWKFHVPNLDIGAVWGYRKTAFFGRVFLRYEKGEKALVV